MTEWILLVALSCGWSGCGEKHFTSFPSEESCYKALGAIKLDSKVGVAYCYPKKEKSK